MLGRITVLIATVMFGFSGCTGEGDSGNGSGGDGNGGGDGEFVCGSSRYSSYVPVADDGSVLGYWRVQDTNALNWLSSFEATDLYMAASNDAFLYWMPKENGVECFWQAMKRKNESRFIPEYDPDNCWFDLKVNEQLRLELTSRNAADEQSEAWWFMYQRVDEIPELATTSCFEVCECWSFEGI